MINVQLFALAVLAIFGTHRFWQVVSYLRLRHRRPSPKTYFTTLPQVTVQLPVFNERQVLERLLAHATKLTYPRDRFEIQLLDDSTDGSSSFARECCERYRRAGIAISHRTRDNRLGYKAGALDSGLKQAQGEFVLIFDADFTPPPDFLLNCIHYFTDPSIDMVLARWGHLNAAHSLLTRAQAVLLDGHFQIEHTVRHRSGLFFNFNGTAGIWRKSAIERAGGWQGDTLTEDLDLSYRAQLAGSQFVYLVDQVVPAELPVQIDAFKSQQHRWTKGAIEVLLKLGRQILSAPIPLRRKTEAMFHLGANFCYPFLLLTGILILPCLHAQYVLENVSPLLLKLIRGGFFLAFLSIFSFYVVAANESRPQRWLHTAKDVILALILGIGLSLSNSIAIIEALVRKKSSFCRTPKTGSVGRKSSLTPNPLQTGSWRRWLPLVELSLAGYFLLTSLSAIHLARWEALPFSLLFFLAFAYYSLSGFRSSIRLPFSKAIPLRTALPRLNGPAAARGSNFR